MVAASNKEHLTPWICLISRLSTLFVGREMSRIGFGLGQFFLLSELYAEEGLSQDELSRRVGVDKSNTSRALAKLEKYGLIRRESDQKNHRVKKIYLGPKALKIKKEFRKIQNQWNAELLSGFSEKEKSELLSSLKKLANNAESFFYTELPQAQPSGNAKNKKHNQRRSYYMELTDILSKEEWAQFEKELFDRFHINCTVYDTSGIGVTGKPNWCNKLCPEIKANKDSLAAICAPGNQNFMAQAKQTKMPIIGECDAGLIKIAVPIFFNGDFLGTAGGCGLLPEGGELETFMIEKSMGLSESEIADFCEGLNSMTKEQAKEMADFIENRIDQYLSNYVKKSDEF